MYQLLPFVMFFFVIPIWIFTFIYYARQKISCMAGMMTAMTIGMSVGLGVGTWAAVILPIPMFYSMMIGSVLGGMAGALAGLPVSLMAVLDGMLSGVMAGMMGAMSGEMITAEYRMLLLKIMGIFAGGVLFLLFIMLQNEVSREHLTRYPALLRRPIWMFIVIVVIGIGMELVHDPNEMMPVPDKTSVHNHGS